MKADEARDAGALTGTALSEVAEIARDVHRAVAARLFGLVGTPAEPIRRMHDGIAAIAYTSTCVGMRTIPAAAGLIAGALGDPAAESVHDRPRGRVALGAVSGFWGDRMVRDQAALAPVMRMRVHGGPLRRLPENLAGDTDESVTGRIVIFAHGLCESDLCWSFAAEKRWGDRTTTYGSMLRDHDGWTPLYLNFNTGLHISQNGRELADLLENLVSAWPVPVTEIALVGHSLGGLLARSAAHQADELNYVWARTLRHIVGLGTPHLGAPLERFANWGTHRLARHPETTPIAQWLNRRSVGIKDLRYGALLEADWFELDPDELLQDRCTDVALIPGVAYSMVSATLSLESEGFFAHDLLVQHASAHGVGKPRSIPFDTARSYHLGGRKHHFDLLADSTVYDKLRGWLAGADGAGTSGEDTDATRRRNRRRLRRQKRTS